MKATAFREPADLRAWLEANGASANELLIRCYKSHARHKGVTYPRAVDEALCFGWIDGVRRPIDADTFSVRFSPRKAKSLWSKINRTRARELIKEGRMRPPGLAAFEKGTPSQYSFESRPATLDPAYEKRLKADKKAWAFWQGEPPGRRRISAFWVMSAKQEETRARRFQILFDRLARGTTLPLLTRTKKK